MRSAAVIGLLPSGGRPPLLGFVTSTLIGFVTGVGFVTVSIGGFRNSGSGDLLSAFFVSDISKSGAWLCRPVAGVADDAFRGVHDFNRYFFGVDASALGVRRW